MNISHTILVLIVAEVAIIIIGGLIAWALWSLRRHKLELSAAQNLVESIRHDETSYLAKIREFLSNHLQLENSSVIAEKLVERERNFYKYFIRIYLKRDYESFLALPKYVKGLIESYQNLMIQSKNKAHDKEVAPTHYLGDENQNLDETQHQGYLNTEKYETTKFEINHLESENLRLSKKIQSLNNEIESLNNERESLNNACNKFKEELDVTLKTMEKMVHEYSNIYGMSCVSLVETTTDRLLEALVTINNDNLYEQELAQSNILTNQLADTEGFEVEHELTPEHELVPESEIEYENEATLEPEAEYSEEVEKAETDFPQKTEVELDAESFFRETASLENEEFDQEFVTSSAVDEDNTTQDQSEEFTSETTIENETASETAIEEADTEQNLDNEITDVKLDLEALQLEELSTDVPNVFKPNPKDLNHNSGHNIDSFEDTVDITKNFNTDNEYIRDIVKTAERRFFESNQKNKR